MKSTPTFVAGCLALGALASSISTCLAQSAPPPSTKPFPGWVNEYLRQQDPAWTPWDFGGNERLRYEVHEGYGIAGSPGSVDFRDHGADVSNSYLLSRLRFHAGYTANWWAAYAEGRSSAAWGDDRFASFANPLPPATANRRAAGPESDTIDLHQANFTIGNLKEFPLSLKLGRQELSYDDERLVGAFGWNNIGRVFDAAKVRWQTDWFTADAFSGRVVIPVDGRFNVSNDYEWFSGFDAVSAKIPKHTLEVYFLARNASQEAVSAEPNPQVPQPGARDIYTMGARLKSKPGQFGGWDYSLESAFQFGNFRDRRLGATSPRLDHEAWMFVGQAGYTFTQTWATPRLGLEYAVASGDSDPNDGKHGTFDNLYPTNHKFYGYMDFFSLQNTHDLRGMLTLKPYSRLQLSLEGHGFWLADTHDNFYTVGGAPRGGIAATPGDNFGINPRSSSYVGSELDVIASLSLTRLAQLEAGYGHFFVGEYIQQSLAAPTVGSRDADFLYLQFSVNF